MEWQKNFYRLRVIWRDNTITYSNIAEISKKGPVPVSVMPDPVADAFTIRFQSLIPPNYQVMLAECQRPACFQQKLFSKPRRSQNGSMPGALASGLYYLAVVNKSTNERDIIKLFFK